MPYFEQSRIAPDCEHQDALLRISTCRPTFKSSSCRHRSIAQHSHFHLPSLAPRPSSFAPVFVTAAPPTSHLTSYPSQQPTPPLTLSRNDTPRIRIRRGKPKYAGDTPPTVYKLQSIFSWPSSSLILTIFWSLTPRCWQYYSLARPTLLLPFWLVLCGSASCRT